VPRRPPLAAAGLALLLSGPAGRTGACRWATPVLGLVLLACRPGRPGRLGRARVAPLVVAGLVLGGCSGGARVDGGPSPTAALSAPAWEQGAAAPRALTEVAAAGHDGRVWVAGGYEADGSWVTDVQVLDPAAGTWSPGPGLPEPVNHAALVSTGEDLLLIGGYAGAAHAPTRAVRVLDEATGTWTDGPPLPEARAAGAAAHEDERVVYGGGVGPDGVAQDIWALEDGAWREVGSLARAREHLAAASDGRGVVWFLGGRRGDLDENEADVDIVTGERTRRLGELPTARGGVAGFAVPGAGGCAVGGEGPDGTFGQVECMDDAGAVTVLPALAQPRHGLGAVTLHGVAHALLGGPTPGLSVSPTLQTLRLTPPPER